MQIKEIMTRDIEMVSSNTNLAEAAKKMKDFNIGSLPVWEGDDLVGIITDRDLVVRGIAEGGDPASKRVSDAMTTEVFYCFEDDEIHEAANLMEEKCIRRLLVLNSEGAPVGIVSMGDFSIKTHDEHLCGELLESVSTPGRQR